MPITLLFLYCILFVVFVRLNFVVTVFVYCMFLYHTMKWIMVWNYAEPSMFLFLVALTVGFIATLLGNMALAGGSLIVMLFAGFNVFVVKMEFHAYWMRLAVLLLPYLLMPTVGYFHYHAVQAWMLNDLRYDVAEMVKQDFVQGVEQVARFVDSGKAAKTRDDQGNTLLHIAAELGIEGSTRVLLKAGCSPEALNHSGETPIDIAERVGHKGIVKILQNHVGLAKNRNGGV